MILAVDARGLTGNARGMGRYVWGLIEPVKNRAVALLPSDMPKIPDLTCIQAGHSVDPLWEQLALPKLSRLAGANVLLSPYNTGPLFLTKQVKSVLVVHDLIYMEKYSDLPSSVSLRQNLGRVYRRLVAPRAVARADVVLTVSRYSALQIATRFGIEMKRITVIPNSIDDTWYSTDIVPTSGRENFILVVSGEAPHKNLRRFLEAFSSFCLNRKNKDTSSVVRIVGVDPKFHPFFRDFIGPVELQERVIFENRLSDQRLIELYRQAAMFVMPSLYEGFGIPLVEAMASGTPVVCSNTTSLPEVAAGCARLFDPRSVDDMCRVMTEVWDDTGLRREMASLGARHAEVYRRGRSRPTIERFWQSVL